MSERDRMGELAARMEGAGIRVVGWRWIEQGGPFTTATRIPAGQQGHDAEPLRAHSDFIEGGEQRDWMRGLADLIEALLPPVDLTRREREG